MCVVSAVGDNWRNDWEKRFPSFIPSDVSRAEFESLKREVEALKELLKAAKKYDEETGQKDCEMEDKIELIRKVAEHVGVDLSEVFGEPK